MNGVKAFEGTSAAPLPLTFYALFLGADANGDNVLDGWIDEFAVFASALPAEAIAELAGGKRADAFISGGAGGASGMSLAFDSAKDGTSYDIEYSPDLKNWSVIQSGLSGKPIHYEDSEASRMGRGQGFYRFVEK